MITKFISLLIAVFIFAIFGSSTIRGQVHDINLPIGKKVTLKGQVSSGEGNEQLYIFQAKPKQRLTVNLTSVNDNAVFSINEQYRVDHPAIEEEKNEWSGNLPETESNGLYSISVTSTKGTAGFTLEITLGGEVPDSSKTASPAFNTDNPKNVKDYYLLIPEKYNGYSRTEREEFLESSDTFIDIKNGYIGSHTGTLGEAFQVTLFRKPGGGYVIAYNEDGDPEIRLSTKLYLLEYEAGQWANVTARLLPVPVNKLYSYDLPDIGTTIEVKTSKGKKVYSLIWRNGRFEKS